jgi:hypothetical protein
MAEYQAISLTMMYYLALLPLLALPVLGGVAKREPNYIPICDTPTDGHHRLAVPHSRKSLHLFQVIY